MADYFIVCMGGEAEEAAGVECEDGEAYSSEAEMKQAGWTGIFHETGKYADVGDMWTHVGYCPVCSKAIERIKKANEPNLFTKQRRRK